MNAPQPITEGLPPLPAACVLDTNTVLALWLFEDPGLVRLRTLVADGILEPLASEGTITELCRVLAYPRFELTPERQRRIADVYLAHCRRIDLAATPAPVLPACRDPDDQKFLELAVAAGAPLLISRDKALLRLSRHRLVRGRLRILRPEMIEEGLARQAARG